MDVPISMDLLLTIVYLYSYVTEAIYDKMKDFKAIFLGELSYGI